MHKSKLKRIALAICFAFLPFSAHSAGLGKLTVISGLGEPLRAEIDLVSTTPEELSTLTAAIAPQEAYTVQGLERKSVHNQIKVDVVKKSDGTGMLKLSTHQPIDDPFLDMLIQVDWATGRLLREYTALLDPPGYQDSQTAVMTAAPASPAESARPITSKPLPEPPSSSPVSTYVEQETGAEYTTKSGDNLSKIAKEMQLEGYSLDQMLVALYRSNPDAFDGGNMNRLKVGQIIKAPSYDDLSAVTPQEATQEIRVQTSDWNAYRNKLAGIVADSAPMAEDGGEQATSGKLKTATEDKAAPVESGPKDVVKLSKSEADKSVAANADAKALQDKLSAMQEENDARQKSVAEANERVAMLEKQIADLQALLTIKDKTLSGLQEDATAINETPADAGVQTPDTAAETPSTPETASDVGTATEATPPVTQEPKPVAKIAPAPVQQAAPEPSLIDDLMSNSMLLGLAGGAVLLLGGGWAFLRNRRKQNLDSFEQGILTAGGLKANTVFGNTSGGTVDTGDTSFLTDFSQSPSGMIDTHDVDPIAEAEVYMAYGRDSQAEEILNDAISKEPTRYELHLKLLEIFAGRNDTSAFEAVAGELYSTLGSSDPVWAKVAEMGHKMEPTNPLYDLSTGHSAANKAEPLAAAAAVMSSAMDTTKLDASDFSNAEVMTESSLDFSLDSEPASTNGDNVKHDAEDSSLDFNLGFDASEPVVESTPAISASMEDTAQLELPAKQDNEISFDMDFGDKAEDSAQAAAQESTPLSEVTTAEETVQFEAPKFSETLPNLELPKLDITEELSSPTSEPEFLDLSGFASETETVSAIDPELPTALAKEDSSGLDFSFDLGGSEEAIAEANEINIDSVPVIEDSSPGNLEVDLSGISFDMDVSDTATVTEAVAAAEDELEEVNTKLDLVTAYMDMGDSEGARELLDEVLKEGGSKQRERAQALLNSLS